MGRGASRGDGATDGGDGGSPPVRLAPDRRSRRRRRWRVAAAVAVAGGVAVVAWVAVARVTRPLPRPDALARPDATVTAAGAGPSLPWPATGQGAVAVPALGYAAQSGPESPVPVASLTKMANAVVVLRDHPLVGDAPGPTITVTAADVAEYQFDLHNDESTVPIEAGEQLTERQMLEAMLTQSANDVAYSLALWDAGSEPAFVAKMNALAASLGATSTHFVDATGYDPDSRSTAADLLRIAAAGMAVPAFADTVSLTSVTLPLLGTVPNIVPQIGTDGIVGIKSGYTSHAGGCMVLAAYRVLDGRRVLVLAAVVAQPTPPPIVPPTTTTTTTAPRPTTTTAPPTTVPGTPTTTTTTTTTEPPTTTTTIPIDDRVVPDPEKYAAPAATALLDAARAAVVRADVVARGEALGTVTTRWGDTDHRVEVVAAAAAWLAAWPGQRASGTVTLVTVPPGASTGTRVGTARFTLGTQQVGVPVQLAGTVPEPDWWWRLLHAG